MLHIAEVAAATLKSENIRQVGLLATDGTLKADFYPDYLHRMGIHCSLPSTKIQAIVMQGIYQVKAGKIRAGARLLEQAAEHLFEQGVEKIILGCTEIPLAFDAIDSPLRRRALDASQTLAQACVDWYQLRNKAIAA